MSRCFIVPPHLLKAISESSANSDVIRQSALAALSSRQDVVVKRKNCLHRAHPRSTAGPFIPAHVLRHISESEHADEASRAAALRTLERDSLTTRAHRMVYDARHVSSEAELPGKLVRAEGDKETKDNTANEAYDNVGTVLEFFKDVFGWKSIDDKYADIISSVHFGEQYENAFWDSKERQMVFGDGDEFLSNFTGCVDVIGHELTHAVTEHTTALNYEGQPGALNEHVSDVFGIMIKQKAQNEKAKDTDWLIGEDCILPGVKGVALRSMKAPGTAYDDPRFGKDPQVDNMRDFQQTYEDNGGVHIYSGIPNKAFYLVAQAFGGYSWEKAGKIWWKTLQTKVHADCTFLQFADATVEIAEQFDPEAAQAVRKAWDEVGVKSDDSGGWCVVL
ncbi:hypothetical protein TGAM01_v205484 [Trichoderma gamsii]|uniref:Peptidase M4 C-terminal domain-containing protein n=1 Tax=Trichoderma gamsii TaxID=398673 RepID=A0A2P4ZMT3_9HYPO|nr:hypothetical protein TGAM01_v205484 [Trichoderma gamsii]PON25599.1 hypothetical protein TGAM01_v205484 [Trichoderma gamsii]